MRLGVLGFALLVLLSGAARADAPSELTAQRVACAAAMTRQCLLDLLSALAASAAATDPPSRGRALPTLAAAHYAAGAEASGDEFVRQYLMGVDGTPYAAQLRVWSAVVLGHALLEAGEVTRAQALAVAIDASPYRNVLLVASAMALARDGQPGAAADLLSSHRVNLRGYSDIVTEMTFAMVTGIVRELARRQHFDAAIALANDEQLSMLGPAMAAVAIEQARAGLQSAAQASAEAAVPGVRRVGPAWQANVRGFIGIAQMSAGLEERGRANFLIGRRAVLEAPEPSDRVRGILMLLQFLAWAGYDDEALALIPELTQEASRTQAYVWLAHAQLDRARPDAARAIAQVAPSEHRDGIHAELAAYFAARGDLATAGEFFRAIGGDETLIRTISRIVRYGRR